MHLTSLLICCLFLITLIAEAKDGEIKVRLGKVIERSLEKVKKENNVYGPKQAYNPETKETQVYLPYGTNKKFYYKCEGLIKDAEPGKCAMICNPDGKSQNDVNLTYKLVFNKPITSFRMRLGLAELVLSDQGEAGVEYSTNGKKWNSLVNIKGPLNKIKEPFVNGDKATGLNTKVLYIRMYARLIKKAKNKNAGRWIKLRMSGDPNWGDGEKTFFKSQILIRVKGK